MILFTEAVVQSSFGIIDFCLCLCKAGVFLINHHLKRLFVCRTVETGFFNPRYCLYQAPYTVLHADRDAADTAIFDLAGRCCESGDIIQPDVALPASIRRGDLLAVCTTGAYNYSMASNYNRLGRPPVVMLRGGASYLAVRRECVEDLCALDL